MMEHLIKKEPQKRWLRFEPWPAGIVLFFVVVFVVNAIFIRLSMVSWTGVVTEGAYAKGLVYNQVLKAQQEQDALGWRVEMDGSDLQVGRQGRLRLFLADRNDQPLSGARVEGLLFRPVAQGMDQSFMMSEADPGVYGADLQVSMPGHWEIRLQIEANGAPYRYVHRIHLPAKRVGE